MPQRMVLTPSLSKLIITDLEAGKINKQIILKQDSIINFYKRVLINDTVSINDCMKTVEFRTKQLNLNLAAVERQERKIQNKNHIILILSFLSALLTAGVVIK